jgi:hypothetical protein
MSASNSAHEIARREIAVQIADVERVEVELDLPYPAADGELATLDLYRPPGGAARERDAVVVLVPGYPDPGFERFVGCRFKEMGSSRSWARAIAASGMAAVVPSNRAPEADAIALLAELRARAEELQIDPGRVGLWASSGNAPLALSLLMRHADVERSVVLRCAALLYPFLLDLEGATSVAEAAASFRFANPCAGRTIADLPDATPLLVVRAGSDATPGLVATLDRFAASALAEDLPLTLVNLPGAPHAFDLFDERSPARTAILQVLAFLRAHLLEERGRPDAGDAQLSSRAGSA